METKDVQLQGKTELISIFCCSSSWTRPAQLFNLCAEPRARCLFQQWNLLLSDVTRGLRQVGKNLAEGRPLANTQKKFKKWQWIRRQVTLLHKWNRQGIYPKFLIGNWFHEHYASSALHFI